MAGDEGTPDRETGVEFDDVEDALADHDFPATGKELIEAHGDRRLGHQAGEERFGAVLEPVADETFESPREVKQAVLTVIGDGAVGRKGYSDRDPPRRDESDAADQSF